MAPAPKRAYESPLRTASAAATRSRILAVAKATFEEVGWAGASLGLIAARAGVSAKTIQAQFGTKPRLLADAVDFSVRGGAGGQAGSGRGTAQAIRNAADARQALELHAGMSTRINGRVARLAAVVEAAAAAESAAAPLWERMRENMQFGVRWAAQVVMTKPGLRLELTDEAVESVFQIGMAWGTHRTLSLSRGMSQPEIEGWISDYYVRMLLV